MTRPSVSIVVPVYNSAQTLRPLVSRLTTVLEAGGAPYEIILVDDGSRDDSADVARALRQEYETVRLLRLLRNYGQHNAILCGLRRARHSVIVTLDDDLQHPPEEIPRLLETLGDQYDLVYGMAEVEQHGLLRDLASRLTKIVMQQVLSVEAARKVSGFRAFRLVLRSALDEFSGPYVNIDVMLTWATTRVAGIPLRHEPRRVGRSNYTVRWLMRHALNMLTGFSVLPLRISSLLGFVLTLFGIAALGFVLGRYLLFGVVVPGFSFLASIIIVFSGTQLFALGIMGEYLARMHFRLLGRPSYALRSDEDDPVGNPVR